MSTIVELVAPDRLRRYGGVIHLTKGYVAVLRAFFTVLRGTLKY